MADDRSKAIETALSQLEKQFGKGSVMRLGSKEAIVPISVISTGSISFDAALGVGGVPRGRVIEIFGPEPCRSSPKRRRPAVSLPSLTPSMLSIQLMPVSSA